MSLAQAVRDHRLMATLAGAQQREDLLGLGRAEGRAELVLGDQARALAGT